jgi:hypothetical protein
MNHHGPCLPLYIFDVILCHTIVVMSSNTAVGNSLTFFNELAKEFLRCVNSVVSPVVCYSVSNHVGFALKGLLGSHSFMGIETHLVYDFYPTTGSITKESATTVVLRGYRGSTPSENTSWH